MMKNALNSLALTAGRKMASFREQSNEQRALLIPPAIPGSLGDAAMVSASGHFLRQHRHSAVDLMYGKKWNLDISPDRRISAERYFYQGEPLQKMMLIRRLADFSNVYFIGADVIDGAYNPASVCARLLLLSEAARMGKNATVLGSSYNCHPESTTMNALRTLPKQIAICARDPVSRGRMEDALQRPVRQVADLAFLLPAQPSDKDATTAIDWIEKQRARGNQVIGVNANYLHAEKNENIPAALLRLMSALLKNNLSIVLVPHDTRSRRCDQKLLAAAAAALPAEYADRIHMLPPNSPGAIKAVLAKLDLLVSGRMHAAILAMSGGTPTYAFAYQDKFEGLYSFFGLEHAGLLSSPTELVERPERIASNILVLLENHHDLRLQINQKLPSVLALARENFR